MNLRKYARYPWAAMSHLTPTKWNVFFRPNSGMRELSDSSKVVNEKEVCQEMFDSISTSTNLFAYPAMSNFCGKKYPYQNWLELSKCNIDNERKWYLLLDAASYVSTNPLDLEACQPDFVCISFYKIFGYPTGIGALLVKCSSMDILTKKYFGGGTVDMSLVRRNFHIPRSSSLEGNYCYQKQNLYNRTLMTSVPEPVTSNLFLFQNLSRMAQ